MSSPLVPDALRQLLGTTVPTPAVHLPCTRPSSGVLLGGTGDLWLADQGTVRVWRAGAWDTVTALPSPPRHVVLLARSPDGHHIALAGRRRVSVRHTNGPAEVHSYDVPQGIFTLACSNQGQVLVGSGDARTWFSTSTGFASVSTHAARVSALCWLDDGRFASGALDGTVVVVDLGEQHARRVARLPQGVSALAASSPSRLAAADSAGNLLIWQEEGAPPISVNLELGPVLAIQPEPEDRLLVVTSTHGATVDAESGKVLIATPIAHRGRRARGLAGASPTHLWTWDDSGLCGWDRGRPGSLDWWGHDAGVRAIVEHQDAIWTSDRRGVVCAWDPSSGARRSRFQTGAAGVQALLSCADGTLLCGTTQGTLTRLDTTTGQTLTTVAAHEGPVTVLRDLGDGEHVISGGADGVLRCWSGLDLRPVHGRHDHTDRLRCAHSVDGERVLTGGYDGMLVLASAFGGPTALRIQAHGRPVTGCVALDDHSLLSVSLDGRLRRWTADGQAAGTAVVDDEGVVGLALCGRQRVACIGRGGVVGLWDTETLQPVDTHALGLGLDALALIGGVLLVSDQRGGLHRFACDSAPEDPPAPVSPGP